MTGWILLSAAIAAEVLATTTLALSNGLTRHALTAVTVALYVLSYACLARALKAGMEIGVAYAAWSGVGTTALAVIGVWLFGEAMTLRKICAIVLIIGGVTLLHLTSTAPPPKPLDATQTATTQIGAAAPNTTASKSDARTRP